MSNTRELLRSESPEGRLRAVNSLRGLHDIESMGHLLEALKDADWRIRKAATDLLRSQFLPEDYIAGLLSLLAEENNAGARNSAIDLLITLGRPAIPYLLRAFETESRDVRKFVIDIIGEIPDKSSLPLLLSALRDDDDNVRASAVEHLGKMREPSVVGALIEILESGDLWTSYPAADALGKIGDRTAVAPLVKALGVKALREPVLRSLACFPEAGNLDCIVPLLAASSRGVQGEVLRCVARYYGSRVSEEVIAEKMHQHLGESAFGILMEYAWNSKADVRVAAILLLGILKDRRAFGPLLEMSTEEGFAEEIRRAMIFMGREYPEQILGLYGDLATPQRRFLTGVAAEIAHPSFFEPLLSLLGDNDGHVRSAAARGLARIGDIAAVPGIMELLDDPYVDVQESAIEALVVLRAGVSRSTVIAGLYAKSPAARRNSALLLGRLGDKAALSELCFTMKDAEMNVRKACVKALSLLGDAGATRYLLAALTDEMPAIRIEAAHALGGIDDRQVRNALALLLSDREESVRVAAAKALGSDLDSQVEEILINALVDGNGFVVAAVLEALGKLRSERARDAIASMLSSADDEIRRTAIRALGGYEEIFEEIVPFLDDPDWATRLVAAEAIGISGDERAAGVLMDLHEREEDRAVREAIEAVLRDHC